MKQMGIGSIAAYWLIRTGSSSRSISNRVLKESEVDPKSCRRHHRRRYGLIPPIEVNPDRVREFENFEAFHEWLGEHHDKEVELWIKIHKVGSGLRSITPKEAIDVVLCWGWIDGVRKSFDDKSYLQRYTPRGRKSIWSQINVDSVGRLIREGRMTEYGLAKVEAAKADGRWARAYGSGKAMKIPDDLQAAIDAEPQAKEMLAKLSEQNRFALAFRTHNMKTEAGRERKIAAFVQMLKRGETIHPQGKHEHRTQESRRRKSQQESSE
jgi:uncharacterized protein YdeI (YjbR/CyaY-like superfamily)